MSPRWKRVAPLLAGLLATIPACADSPTEVTRDGEPRPRLDLAAASISVVMSGLDSPRGLAWGPQGGLYVAEAGSTAASAPCAAVARGSNCYSGTGALSRLWRGRQERVASGLPSLFNANVSDIIGPHDVAFHGGVAYVTIGWGGDPAARAQLGGLGNRFGTLIAVRPSGQWDVVADLAALELGNPDGGILDSNPYGALAEPGVRYAVDAAGNTLIEARADGDVRSVAVFPSTAVPPGPFNPPFARAESVPTEVARGPDGALYVSTLSGVPFLPGAAAIYRVVPGQSPQLQAGGFTQVTDFDWGPDGSLYVLQYASAPFLNGPGALIRVAPDGTRTTITTALFHATGVLAGPDGEVYVSNNGNLAGVGEVLRIVP